VTQRLHQLIASGLLALSLLTLMFAPVPVHAADGIEIIQAHIESTEEGYRLSTTFAFDLTRDLEEVITRGVPLYFTTDVELTRPRWYWFDEKTITTSQTVRISYNVLTRQFHAAIVGHLQQSFPTLEDALTMVRRPGRWLIADRDMLQPGQLYRAAVRMRLDLAQLPKPFQVHALNSSDWRLSSDWKFFRFIAE
jgi:hypothetical protein